VKEILLDKKEALRIATSILNKEKVLGDYGFTALKEAELILKNILETLEVEEQMLAEKTKAKAKRKKLNNKVLPMQKGEEAYLNDILNSMDESHKQGLTILDLEKGEKSS